MFFNNFVIKKVIRDPGFQSGSLQGYINENYFNLVEVFGEPTHGESGDSKVFTEWELAFVVQEEGEEDTETVYATIYDWKEAGPMTAREATKYNWHIGGKSKKSVEVVEKAIANHFGRQA
jgi:hypothetical protein